MKTANDYRIIVKCEYEYVVLVTAFDQEDAEDGAIQVAKHDLHVSGFGIESDAFDRYSIVEVQGE